LQSEHREAELRASQEQRALAETFAALGDLTANLLHQLNNKVGVIPVRIEGIRDRCQISLDADQYLARNLTEVECNAQDALRVVRESFQLLDPKSVGPTRVEKCVILAAQEVKLTVSTSGLAELPPVVGGQPGVRLVFWNLFDNARRILRAAGLPEEVSVSGSLVDDKVMVEVSDRGPGVDPRSEATWNSPTRSRGLAFGSPFRGPHEDRPA
jgi:signal transduction histidine kinase